MVNQARVIVVGGGVIGCSVLYHLTRRGWTDVALLERTELTAGSTWHAAGGMHTLNGDPNVAALQKYTLDLYDELERTPGSACGVHRPGCLYLASSRHEIDAFLVERAKARCLGLDLDFIDLAEAARLNPLLDVSHFTAAMFDPNDGHVDPSGVTHALANSARAAGARIHRRSPVTAVRRLDSGEWELSTPAGPWRCEFVVNAAGLWARDFGRLLGVELPIVPLEHQYVITDEIPELVGLGREIAVGVDFGGGSYFRQERTGLLLGTYEQDCRHWSVDGTPPDFGVELLPSDLDRIAGALGMAMQRIPALARTGIRRVVNGAMVFSPDGNPIVGPIGGIPGAFVAAGCMAGFSQFGGVGLAVANWIVDGEPGVDVFAMDVARYGDWATRPYVLEKAAENYRRRFVIPCPNEQLTAARCLQMTPLHGLHEAKGAVFGSAAGWEVPMWFARSRAAAHEPPTFGRSAAYGTVAEECAAVRTTAGLWDVSSYCKIEIRGPHAAQWLDELVANHVPPEPGRLAISPMLTTRGRLFGDVTVLRTDYDRLLVMGSPAAEPTYLRWMTRHSAPGVTISSVTRSLAGVSLSGPAARSILASTADADVSNEALPFLRIRSLRVGLVPVMVARLSFTGELGYEIYTTPDRLVHVYRALHEAGASLGMRDFGVRALDSLRLEKGYGGWGREYTQDYTPAEARLERLVRIDKPSFVGRDAFLTARTPARLLATLRIETNDVDPTGGEPVLRSGRPIARLTSAAHGYTIGAGVGLAYMPPECLDANDLEVEILGTRCRARATLEPPHDPSGSRLRA